MFAFLTKLEIQNGTLKFEFLSILKDAASRDPGLQGLKPVKFGPVGPRTRWSVDPGRNQ